MRRKILAFAFLGLSGFAALAQGPGSNWVGTWAASPVGSTVNSGQPGPANSTYRNIVHISLGGSAVRVQLTNEFGTEPLTVGAAHIAVSAVADRSSLVQTIRLHSMESPQPKSLPEH